MNFKLALASLSLVAVAFTACGEDKKPVVEETVAKTETVAPVAKVETETAVEKTVKTETAAPVATSEASDGAKLYGKCAGCHGADAEKPALGKSQIIAGWDSAKIEEALHGYKDGSYGGAMKGLMKGQIAALSDADIKALAEFISKK